MAKTTSFVPYCRSIIDDDDFVILDNFVAALIAGPSGMYRRELNAGTILRLPWESFRSCHCRRGSNPRLVTARWYRLSTLVCYVLPGELRDRLVEPGCCPIRSRNCRFESS